MQWQPVHTDYRIHITSSAITGRWSAVNRLHPPDRACERIQMDTALAVDCGHIHTNATELDMHEHLIFWSLNGMLRLFGQRIGAFPGVSSHGTECNLATIIGYVGYAAGVGPGELSMKPVTLPLLCRIQGSLDYSRAAPSPLYICGAEKYGGRKRC